MNIMAKSSNQKLKLLYLIEMFEKYTDEEHYLTMKEIIAKLEANDIKAERKSIYDDIEALRFFGYDIELNNRPAGYYLSRRKFELPELKMLVDSVSSSKFLSEKKSNGLIKKFATRNTV
jgi:predicted DNA-binding transcriptional regulator YafY